MAAPTRDEIIAEMESLRTQLSDALVPDGRTGLTSLSGLKDLRRDIRARMSELRTQLAVLDNQGCTARRY